jgi:predicted O-linked N-acetylglucosamine transferase (SPINDLY family)
MKPRKTDNTIILAAINKVIKNSKHTLATWAIILKECPHVKILIKLEEVYCDNDEYIKYYTTKLNVPSNRIILMNKLIPKEYTNLFGKFDILLDTFPYSGTTTTCNALFNSLPIVTMYNKNHHSHNVSASLLTCMGVTELIAYTNEEYVDIVKNLVNNPNKIDEYKQTIGKKFNETVMNPTRFMKHYQNALITAVKNIQ